jgi:tetratricopeptide (TPR) repeat protein
MRTTLLLLLLLSFGLLHDAQAMSRIEADSLTVRAQHSYASGDHAKALVLFDSVATYYTSAALQFNLGNCYFKLGDVPRAILHYERALRLEPGAEDVRANLDMAREKVVDRINELPGFALGATWGKVRGGSDIDQWARNSLWACLALFCVLGAVLFARSRLQRQILFVAAGLLVPTTAIMVTLAAYRSAEVNAADTAIIMSTKVDGRSEPRDGATVLFVLHKGTKVTVQQEQSNWLEVRLPNGTVGWMPADALERI